LNTERYAEYIFEAYPGARILHLLRDPRDRFASSLKRWKTIRSGIGGATAIWLSTVSMARRNQQRYPKQYKIVRYEDLVRQPEKILGEICAFIGEDYTPEMLSMRDAGRFRSKGGNSSYGQRKPGEITTHSIGKFRQVLSRRQVAFLQLFSAKTMQDYGYQPDKIHFSPADWFWFVIFELPFNILRMWAWWGREYYQNRIGRDVPSERLVAEHEAAGAGA
jgi:hypothetical protein